MCGCTLWSLIRVFISALIVWWSCTDCTITKQSFQCPEISSTYLLLCVLGVSLEWFPLHTLLKFIIIHLQTTFVYEQHDWSLSFLWVLCEGGMSRMWNTVCAGILPLATLRYEEHLPCQHWIVLSPSSLLLVDQWVAAFKEQVSRIECDFAGYIASLIHWREWLELKSLKNNISVHIVLTVGFWHKSMWRCRSLNNSNVH
jgi:hypothetical protein